MFGEVKKWGDFKRHGKGNGEGRDEKWEEGKGR